MQESERKMQVREQIIFDNSFASSMIENPQPDIQDIMDIPGTAHEKLVKLSEMI
jgi:hypothetical protein